MCFRCGGGSVHALVHASVGMFMPGFSGGHYVAYCCSLMFLPWYEAHEVVRVAERACAFSVVGF